MIEHSGSESVGEVSVDEIGTRGAAYAALEVARARQWRWLVAGCSTYFAVFAFWQVFLAGSSATDLFVNQAVLVPVGVAMVVAAWSASRRSVADAAVAGGWRWIALAWAMLTAGMISTAVHQGIYGDVSFPSVADPFALCFYGLFVIGVSRFPRQPTTRSGRVRLGLDLSVVTLSCVSVIWYLVLGPTLTAAGVPLGFRALSGAYPLGDSLQIFILVFALQRVRSSSLKQPLQLLIGGVLLVVAYDTLMVWLLAHPQYQGRGSGLVQLVAVAALSMNAMSAARQHRIADVGEHSVDSDTHAMDGSGRWLAIVAPVTLFGLVAASQFGTSLGSRLALTVGAIAVGGLVLLRQLLAQRDALAAQEALRHQALHDGLTGLPNRALIMDRIEQLLTRNRRYGTTGAALFVDLDDFKDVNDTLGHEAGDDLLIAVAARLQGALRDADTIGRMGGDEFVVLIDGVHLDIAPELVAERLIEVMRQPFEIKGARLPLMVHTSIGLAIGDRPTGGDLLRHADVALYQAKAAGKNQYAIFHSEMQTDIAQRIELEFDLRSALQSNQFELVYQPIYNLDHLTMVGVEALLRWRHPTQGVLQPDDFIAILEQTGQIKQVGAWAVHEACMQMAAWQGRGHTLDLSVNVSGRQLDDDELIGHIREALQASGLSPSSLVIEVTETALMHDTGPTARRLRAIKDLGVRIAIDDFGTGYSSLAYLQQFPVDCLKIDRVFTNAITASPESKALIGTLVQLGKDLGLRILAEGIENLQQMDHLRAEHVDEAQGFLLARPLDPETLEANLLLPTPVELTPPI